MEFAYYNGNFGKYGDISIPLTDRSIYFGDGVYDAMIGRNGKIYALNEHTERLYRNAKAVGIDLNISENHLHELLGNILRKTCLEEYFIYIQISRKSKSRTHSYSDDCGYNLLITVKDFRLPPIDKRLSLLAVEDKRHFMCDIKSLNLLGSVLAAQKAEENGYDEAVFHRGETVTECSRSNILAIKDGILYTHPNGQFILPGITRKQILKICENSGICYKEIPFTLSELCSADEVLISSTTKLCLSACEFSGIHYPICENSIGTKIIYALRKDYFDCVG